MTREINCDMGESFGLYRMGDDEGIMPYITVANVACGFHASDPTVMHKTVGLAKKHQVKVGAHPALPDLQGFGRREMKVRPSELLDMLLYQVGALKAFLDAEGMRLNHIKPHGALYGMAARSEEIAHAVADAAEVFGVPIYGMAGTKQEQVYTARSIPFLSEFYADLEYDGAGNLVITREHEAVDPTAAAVRCVRAIEQGTVRATDGSDVPVRAEAIAVHSDTPGAVLVAKAVRTAVAAYL